MIQRFSENDTILENLVFLDEGSGCGPDKTPLDWVRRAVCGMLQADDAGIVSRSPAGLAKMMTVIVEVFGAFDLTVSEKKTETLLMRAPEKAQQQGETPTPHGAADCSGRPEVPPGPPVRIPVRPHYRKRRHHARYQPPHQNRLGMFWESSPQSSSTGQARH